jgi:hypothetical protein
MRKFAWLPAAAVMLLLYVAPVAAEGLTIGPAEVELDVPAAGSTSIEFIVGDFTGDIQISMEDIPLTIEPDVVHVEAQDDDSSIELTIYGNESLGDIVFNGKILFLVQSGGSVTYGIKIIATVNHVGSEQLVSDEADGGNTVAVPDVWIWTAAGVLAVGLAGAVVWRKLSNGKA